MKGEIVRTILWEQLKIKARSKVERRTLSRVKFSPLEFVNMLFIFLKWKHPTFVPVT